MNWRRSKIHNKNKETNNKRIVFLFLIRKIFFSCYILSQFEWMCECRCDCLAIVSMLGIFRNHSKMSQMESKPKRIQQIKWNVAASEQWRMRNNKRIVNTENSVLKKRYTAHTVHSMESNRKLIERNLLNKHRTHTDTYKHSYAIKLKSKNGFETSKEKQWWARKQDRKRKKWPYRIRSLRNKIKQDKVFVFFFTFFYFFSLYFFFSICFLHNFFSKLPLTSVYDGFCIMLNAFRNLCDCLFSSIL